MLYVGIKSNLRHFMRYKVTFEHRPGGNFKNNMKTRHETKLTREFVFVLGVQDSNQIPIMGGMSPTMGPSLDPSFFLGRLKVGVTFLNSA